MATGNTDTPYRSLIYLASCQAADGGFFQNFWIDGRPYWTGVQLDQASFAILLAWRLYKAGALREFDPYDMVLRAATFLMREGPATAQERWEENSGYSPSTLAANIAALTCAAVIAPTRATSTSPNSCKSMPIFSNVTSSGGPSPPKARSSPASRGTTSAFCRPTSRTPSRTKIPTALIDLKNRAPGMQVTFPAKEIVNAGFLELVRYGIRKAGDPLIEDSLRVIDHVLKVETPYGPCWRRYNHDGYGQRDDGGAVSSVTGLAARGRC